MKYFFIAFLILPGCIATSQSHSVTKSAQARDATLESMRNFRTEIRKSPGSSASDSLYDNTVKIINFTRTVL